MSNIDLWIRDVLASYGVITSIVLCIVIWIIQKWPTLRKDSYRAHLLGFEIECAELATPYKEHLFKALQYIVSTDEMLRSMGSIRILEIGVKTGAKQRSGPARAGAISLSISSFDQRRGRRGVSASCTYLLLLLLLHFCFRFQFHFRDISRSPRSLPLGEEKLD